MGDARLLQVVSAINMYQIVSSEGMSMNENIAALLDQIHAAKAKLDPVLPRLTIARTVYLKVPSEATKEILDQHSAKVRIPISLLVRLYPRPLNDGQPDLIESSVRYLSAEYGDAGTIRSIPGNDFYP